MSSNGLQQNFILFLEKTKESIEAPRNSNGRFCCVKCRFSTKDTALFERHVAQHEEVTFSCTICNHISYSRVESQRHLVKHKGSFPYKCSWCTYGAVRRDYMVKHIQRIHGKSADGILVTDCTTKNKGTKGLGLAMPRTLGGPSHDVTVVSHSTGNVSNLLSSASQTRPIAPYHVTSTTCGLPIIKSQPHLVPSTAFPVSKFTHGIVNPPNIAVKEVGPAVGKAIEYITNITEKASLEKSAVTGALSRVHFCLSGDRIVQQQPPLQSQVVGTTEKVTIPSKIFPKVQVGYPVSNNNHLKTLLSNQREAPAVQKSVITGAVQNNSVAQRSVPFSANPSTLVERLRHGASSVRQGAQTAGKNSQHRTRPNILVRTPPMHLASNTKSGVQVGMLAPLNQPTQSNRALMVSGPEERNSSRSSVQVELLAPLNQPIQHNKPLTVSCPEEITIPAGCLVELVEVKNVNGTRELELRLVPQLLTGPQQGDLQSTNVAATTNRLSFKCRVATDDNQPLIMNHKVNSSKASAIPEYLVQGLQVKKCSSDDKVNVKNEAEVNEKVLCTRKNGTQAPGSSSKVFHAVSRSAVSNPSESHKFTQQLRAECKNVAADPAKPLSHMHCTVKNISPGVSNKNIKAEGPKYELRVAQPPSNKPEVAESSYQGLPVISSVFSLCPIPQDTLSHIHLREEAQMSVVSGSKESMKMTANPKVCSPTLKTEDETNSDQKYSQLATTKDETLEEQKGTEDMVNEKIDAKPKKTIANDEGDKSSPEICSTLNDSPQSAPSVSMNSSLVSESDDSTQSEKVESAESGTCLLTQSDGPLASSMNPTVALVRMPNLEFFTNEVEDKQDSEESVTARPVVCCTTNQENLQERTIKLVLKRKWSETKTAPGQQTGLLCIDVPPVSKKAKKEKKRAKKLRSSQDRQVLSNSTTGQMFLMPRKDDQPVKLPGPNQPVVVLNHPDPLVKTVSLGGPTLNNQHGSTSAPDLCNQDGTATPIAGGTCPAFKMTLKKVQGQNYQVTELLLKGVAEKPVL